MSKHRLISGWTEQGAAGFQLRVGSVHSLNSGDLDLRLLPTVLVRQ